MEDWRREHYEDLRRSRRSMFRLFLLSELLFATFCGCVMFAIYCAFRAWAAS